MIPMLLLINQMMTFLYTEFKKQNGEGKIRVLHRNLLLPICSSSNMDDKPKPVPRKKKLVPKARKISNHGSTSNRPCVENVDESISDSDNDSIVLYTLEQKPVEVDKVFNDSAATELDNTPVEESIDSNNVPHTDTDVQSDADTYSKHESEQGTNTGSGTHQSDMFNDTVPENSFHRSSVNESNNDEIKREIAIQSPNQNTQGSDSSFIPRRSVRVKSKPQWIKMINMYFFKSISLIGNQVQNIYSL